jgi:glycosyltransferase involved in cell wall biosynthesis
MQIIYGYSNCSDKKYNEIMSGKDISILRPDQKYHGLLIKGLAENGAKVMCLSGLPINHQVTKKILICEPDEQEDAINYHYYTTLNIPVLRHIMIFFGALTNCLNIRKTKDTFAICDCLNIANAYGMAIACKIKRIPIATTVTDLPNMMYRNSILRKIANNLFNMFDGFILLTKQMNKEVNIKNKPYIVLEGHVDSNADFLSTNEKYEQSGKKVVIYAGALEKLYGIKELVDGFLLAELENCELWIFGNGNFQNELKEIAKNNKNIKYMGICCNDDVVKFEQKASLLVNPRPTGPEYTKYSFPSKNMEYMVSGTPVLTSKLPGIPDEYFQYVYLIEDETAEGIAEKLVSFFKEPLEIRLEKGKKARQFVLDNKSNTTQAGKIINFFNIL